MHFSLGIGEESSAEGLGLQNFQGRQCIDCAEAEDKELYGAFAALCGKVES